MKKRKILFCTLFASILFTNVLYDLKANDGDNQTSSASSGYEEKIKKEGQQLEDFHPDSPFQREYYGGYNREGNFKLRQANGTVLNASAIKVTWEQYAGSATTQYYLVNGQYIRKEPNDFVKEMNTYAPQTFILKKDMAKVYSEPFEECIISNFTVKAGTYSSTRSNVDFVEIVLNDGKKVWLNPQYNPNYETQKNGYFPDTKEFLSTNTIGSVPLYQKLMPIREDKRTGYPMKPAYVTIHNTANTAPSADALSHANAQINDSRTLVSWHFTVDDHSIYQSIPMNEVAWHAGDGFGNGNSTSIGIEICENDGGNYAEAEKNAAKLTARILVENGLTVDAVKMHKDWGGKNCPSNIIEHTKKSMGWDNFLKYVETEYDALNKNGWNKKDNGEWEYLVYGTRVDGWQSIEGLQYYFKNYEMVHDWFLDENTQTWYFFNGGVMQRENLTINNITYIFDKDGIWRGYLPRWVWYNNNYYYKDEWNNDLKGWQSIDGLQYKFREDGTMIRDWFLDETTQTWYFFNGGVMQRTNMMINGKLNLFDNDGVWRGVQQ